MTVSSSLHPSGCRCCAGIAVQTPLAIYNRPGLTALAYRSGIYSSFKQSLIARLSDAGWPALRQLRTRDSDDFTIALLDAWAVTADVLTFYQERVANESYLRTAKERLSILEQARLIGYQLEPGLAASTHLVFRLEDAPGAPQQAAAPLQLVVGTRAQSIPGPDEPPQIFETTEQVEARAEWNAIPVQRSEPQIIVTDMIGIWLEGVGLNVSVGDRLLIIGESGEDLEQVLLRVTKTTEDAQSNRTNLGVEAISPASITTLRNEPGVWVMRASASPFGHNAPKEAQYTSGGVFDGFKEWELAPRERPGLITLSARNDRILPGSILVIEQDDPDGPDRLWIFSEAVTVTHLSVARYGIAGNATRLDLSKDWVQNTDSNLSLLRSMTIAAQSEQLASASRPLDSPVFGGDLPLDFRVDGLKPGRPIAVTGKLQRLRITRRAHDPSLRLDGGGTVTLKTDDILTFAGRPMKLVDNVACAISPTEFASALTESPPPWFRLRLMDRDGQSGRVSLQADAFRLKSAAAEASFGSEIASIDSAADTAIVHDRDRTTLKLAAPLTHVYDRGTVTINANVAAATHGESVSETLGSGNAAVPYQTFTLLQLPLTYTSADTPSGSQSTLEVFVNDVLWQEVPFLYGRSANERIYITRQDDSGRTTVQFGDGLTGARLPTGQNNVRARYRKGSGLAGLVNAGQVSQLMSRPLGLKEVVNPEAAQRAEDPEALDDARRNAPLTVLTLDRAVSLRDYEDFSRAFAGIAKAQAVWVWDGRKRMILITVAGPEGASFDEDTPVISQLKDALLAYGDPYVVVRVQNFHKVLFELSGTVTIASDRVSSGVMLDVSATLRDRYSFTNREFGQVVALSEVIAVIQSISGVVSVDIDQFYRGDTPAPPLMSRLFAQSPSMGADEIVEPAELLLLDDNSLTRLVAAQ